MVKISLKKQYVNVSCSKCNMGKSMTTSHAFDDMDAIMQLCPHCFGDMLLATIRQFQRGEGNPDCFGKSNGYCVRNSCRFHTVCVNMRRYCS